MLEFDTIFLDLDDQLPRKLEALTKQGWRDVPGVKPKALYVICRDTNVQPMMAQPMMSSEGFGNLNIDETKVRILDKDGKDVTDRR